MKTWHYDEFRQVGKDFGLPEEVEQYDPSHAQFRDAEAEARAILDRLALSPGDHLVDFGCGTGILALLAAEHGIRVTAVDVSEAMLAKLRSRIAERNIEGVKALHAGFLTATLPPDSADAIVSSLSFHHLPDFWKGIALRRLHSLLKPEGRFFLHDVVLAEERPLETVQDFIDRMEGLGGDFLRDDAETHFREEFSTYDWILEGLLTRAGFRIEWRDEPAPVMRSYLLSKTA